MSGGPWFYKQHEFGEAMAVASDGLTLLASVMDDLDRGLMSDHCLDCTRLAVADALIAYFDTWYGGSEGSPTWQDVLRRSYPHPDCPQHHLPR